MVSRLAERDRVLVVDDDEVIRGLVRDGLEREGFDVSDVADGSAALERLAGDRPSIVILDVNLPAGDFRTTLTRLRSDYGFSPRMFASALVQYSSSDNVFSSNLRFRWEYLPGSELFVVYTDERDTTTLGYPGLKNRAFVVKINRMLRF